MFRGLLLALFFLFGSVIGFKIWQWCVIPSGAPVIGVSIDTAWYRVLGITRKSYEAAITRAKGRMIGIRPGELPAAEVLDRIDGLLLSGGGDVDPDLYGGTAEASKLVDRRRDEFEIALIRGALQRDMPILGICRGIQILNVAHGGTSRNLRDDPKLSQVHGIDLDSLEAHAVEIAPNSTLARVLGVRQEQVSSFHGQAVGRVGEDLTVVAKSSDGVVEALERQDRAFVLAVQWHPELQSLEDSADLAVFEELVRQAEAYRARRGSAR